MALEKRSASQVVTFAPQRPAWSFLLSGGGGAAPGTAGPYAGYPYIQLTQAQAAAAQAGDTFQLLTAGTLKEPTLFRVQALSAPDSVTALITLYFLPAPQAAPTVSDTAANLPQPVSPRWLGAIGHVSALTYSFAIPGGPDQMSCLLQLPPDYRTDAVNPGRVVQVWRGANCVWEGKLDEGVPGTSGWQLTAHGAGSYGEDFTAVWTAWNPDNPVNAAVGRGLRWQNPGIGMPAGVYLGQQVDSGAQTITAFLNLLCSGGALTWLVIPPGASAPPAPPWQLNVIPLPADVNGVPQYPVGRIIVAHSPVPRTIAADINTLVIRYQLTADVPATSTLAAVPATYATTTVQQQASVQLHGPMEFYLDVSSAGVMSAAQAQAIGNNILSKYVRASFAGSFSVGPGQLLNAGGFPVDLGCEKAGTICQAMVADAAYGGEVRAAPLIFMTGQYSFDDDTDTGTVTPLQGVRTDMASLIAALYPGKFG
jgi:hypothetical protein